MGWNKEQLESTLNDLRSYGGDTTAIEVKRATQALPRNIGTTICAFANMPGGGTIILGVDERSDFSITGIHNASEISAGLASVARQAVTPPPQVNVQTLKVDDKSIVIADIVSLPLQDRPALYEGRAYLRQADGDYVMTEHELRMIEAAKARLVHPEYDDDVRVVETASRAELLPDLISDYVASTRTKDHRLATRDEDEILSRTHILRNGHPTIASLYALGDYPQEYFQSLTVTVAVNLPHEDGSRRTRALEHFTGPIPILLDQVMQWCTQNIPTLRTYRPDGHMVETYELPLQAIRELVANALVHRDLSPNTLNTGQSIQIRLRPDRLIIQSPGGLRGISLQQLESRTHSQAAVNRHLYAIAQKLHTADGASIIEGEGGGIQEVFRACREAGLKRPLLEDTGVRFTATLWRHPLTAYAANETTRSTLSPVSKRQTKNEPQIAELLGQHGALTFAQISEQLTLSSGQIRYALKKGLEGGRFVMEGGQGDRETTYGLPPST